MNVQEVEGIARYIKTNFPKFYQEPSAICNRWHGVIGQFRAEEALDAVDYLGRYSDFLPNERSIRDRCQLVRKQFEQREYNREQSHLYNEADLSFEGVPGATRAQQIKYVKGHQSSIHWIGGEHDNDAYNKYLLDAKAIGFEFDGVNYDSLSSTACGDEFDKMRIGL